jgi:hypothetical protein
MTEKTKKKNEEQETKRKALLFKFLYKRTTEKVEKSRIDHDDIIFSFNILVCFFYFLLIQAAFV